jgi:uncharacterized membrane protein YsdA (DUF1294 family)
MSIQLQYSLSGFLLALTMALILEGAKVLSLPFAWLVSINLFTLVFYAIDKLNAKARVPPQEKVRVPEIALHFLALVGGSPAAMVAIPLLLHKVRKGGFVLVFLLIAAAQGAAIFFLRDRLPLSDLLP